MQIVLVIVGVLMGFALRDGSGPFIGGAVGWLVARTIRLQRELDAVKRMLTPRGAPEAEAPQAAAPPPARLAGAEPQWIAAPQTEPPAAVATLSPGLVNDAAPAARAPTQATPASRGPGLLGAIRGWIFGGNTIVKLGVAILFVGLAFLAKYASEHVRLPVEFRLAAIGASAIVLLAFGWRLRHRRPGYAQVLQGGAVAVLYLTLFTAFKAYGVIGFGGAFAMMVAVAALAAALAVLQDAEALAAVGALGGFATPLLVASGSGNPVGLFGYYLVLDLGIAAVAWFRTWRRLNLIGFGFTFGVGAAWGLVDYRPQHYATAQAFLAAFFVVFAAVLLLPARRLPGAAGDAAPSPSRAPAAGERWVNGSLLFGLPTIAFALQYGLVHDTPYGAALSALVLGGFYVALAAWLRRRLGGRPQLALAFEGCLALATVFVTLVIPLALDARATAGAWALEGAGLVWLGWRQARRLARAFGYALVLVSTGLLLHAIDHHGPPTTLFGATLLGALLAAAGALTAAFFVQRYGPGSTRTPAGAGAVPRRRSHALMEGIEAWTEPVLIGLALVVLAAATVQHVEALVQPSGRLAAMVATLASVACIFVALAARLAWRGAALALLGYAPLLLAFAGLGADLQRHPFAHGGWWAWPAALAVHALSLRQAAPRWPASGRHLAHAAGMLGVGLLGALAGRGALAEAGDAGSAWPWLGWLAVPALLVLVLPRPSLLARWPLRDEPLAYARSAAGVMAVSLLGWTLLANAFSNGAAQPLPYLPLLNPLDLGVALALFAALRWLAGDGASALARAWPPLVPVLLGACGFLWLNAMLVRGFHHLGAVPFHVDAWSRSAAVQTGFTLLWTATALPLMWWAARRGLRAPWLAGAALLALVILKLLLVDLSDSGTVTRIVSFIGAGVLMLVIGYVAPMPGKEVRHATS